MKLDLTELNRGAEDMAKEAGWFGDRWENIKHPIDTLSNGIGAVKDWAYDTLTPEPVKAMGEGMAQLGQIAPLAMGGIMAMNGGGGASHAASGAQTNGYYGPRSLITHNPGKVTSLSSPTVGPANYANPVLREQAQMTMPKVAAAGAAVDSLMWAARNRLANNVLNQVTKTNPLGMDLSSDEAKRVEEKKLEITTKYPELAHLMEKEENKAYLRRLMQE